MEEMDLKQAVFNRLVDFREQTGLTLNAFAGTIGMKHATLHNQFHGKRDLSLETIINTLACFSDLSAEWLLRGTGNTYISETSVATDGIDTQNDSRLETLIDTIRLLQDTINVKNKTIDALQAELALYKNKSKKA